MSQPKSLSDWLDDLCARFIINLPSSDLESMERICFQLEEAQWFYEDFIRATDSQLPSLPLRQFCDAMFKHCPILACLPPSASETAFNQFIEYKARIPVRGAILLNPDMDHALLVKGWKKTASWSFPRGKINKDEDDLDCAIREVFEETGFNVREAGLVPPQEQIKYFDVIIKSQEIRLYVFKNVPMDTHFEPQTRKEISNIKWFPMSELPTFKKKNYNDQPTHASSNNKFYMVAPFMGHLKKWIQKQRRFESKRQAGLSDTYLSPTDGIPEESAVDQYSGAPAGTNLTSYLQNGVPTPPQNPNAEASIMEMLMNGGSSGADIAPESRGYDQAQTQQQLLLQQSQSHVDSYPPEEQPPIHTTPPAVIHHPQPIPPQVQKANLDQGLLSYATPPPKNQKNPPQPQYSLQAMLAQSKLQQQMAQQSQQEAVQRQLAQQQQEEEEFIRRHQQKQQQQQQQQMGPTAMASMLQGVPPGFDLNMGQGGQYPRNPYPEQSQSQPQVGNGYGNPQPEIRPGSDQYGQNIPQPPMLSNPMQNNSVPGGNLPSQARGLLSLLNSKPQPAAPVAPAIQYNSTTEQRYAHPQQTAASASLSGNPQGVPNGAQGPGMPIVDPLAMHNGQTLLGMAHKHQQQGMQSEKQKNMLLGMFKSGPSPAPMGLDQQSQSGQPMSQPGSYRQSPMDSQHGYSGPRGGPDISGLQHAMGNIALQDGAVRQGSAGSNYVRSHVTSTMDSPAPLLSRDSISPSIGGHSRHSQTPYNFDRSHVDSTAPSRSAVASPPTSYSIPIPGTQKTTTEHKRKLLDLFGESQVSVGSEGSAVQSQMPPIQGYYQGMQPVNQSSPQQQYSGYSHPQPQYYSSSYQQNAPHPLSQSRIPGSEGSQDIPVTTYSQHSQQQYAPQSIPSQQQPQHTPYQTGSQQTAYGVAVVDSFRRGPSATSAVSDSIVQPGGPGVGKNGAPISYADRNFLLGYLKSTPTAQPSAR